MSEFQSVCKISEIPEGEGKPFEINDSVIAIFNVGNEFFAIDDMCPHAGAALSPGHVDCVEKTVTCPWHAWRFDITDGTWCDNRKLKVNSYELKVEDDTIFISSEPRKEKPDDSDEDK